MTQRRIRSSGVLVACLMAVGAMVSVLWAAQRDTPGGVEPSDGRSLLSELRTLADDGEGPALDSPVGPWRLTLPEDHAAHPGARAETWAIVAHLRPENSGPLSLVFTMSRAALDIGTDAANRPWAPSAAWAGQAALTGETPVAEDRISRGAGAAGFDIPGRAVWIDDWNLVHTDADDILLTARVDTIQLRLTLSPVKRAIPADGGPATPIRGFAMPRLALSGTFADGPSVRQVSGTAWMDRLWGELPMPGGPLVRDRMVLHLQDGTDIALLRTRRRDGRGIATLTGTVVDRDGAVREVDDTTLALTGGADARDGSWHISGQGLDLAASPLPGSGERDFALPALHGALAVDGTADGVAVSGLGTVILGEATTP
jgi:predicted secreted hydrolase